MSSKEQAHSNDKAVSKHRSPQPTTSELTRLEQGMRPESAIQRAKLDPRSLTPQDMLQIQRTIGNQAVSRLLAGTVQDRPTVQRTGEEEEELRAMPLATSITPLVQREIIQRAKGDPAKLSEENWAAVKSGETITYTALAAGCLAVTAELADGGGAGVHLAMRPNNPNQWADYQAQIKGAAIKKLHLDCELLGQANAWLVKGKWDEDMTNWEPELDKDPKSLSILQEGMSKAQIGQEGWVNDVDSIKNWFQKATGAQQVGTSGNTSPAYKL